MGVPLYDKHFLDTSVFQKTLLGSAKYRAYLKEYFKDDRIFISKYIKMEFRRSYILKLLDFYFVFNQPEVKSFEDAAEIWSNRFRKSELKAVIRLFGTLLSDHKIELSSTNEKEKALKRIAYYIKRTNFKARNLFPDMGKDSTRCERAKIELVDKINMSITETFKRFIKEFRDVNKCRGKCAIDKFFLIKFKQQILEYIRNSKNVLSPNKKENSGFIGIVKELEKIIEKGSDACSCNQCEKVGDAVIALDAPRNMCIECIDHAFDYLCPPLRQPYKKHPPENLLFK